MIPSRLPRHSLRLISPCLAGVCLAAPSLAQRGSGYQLSGGPLAQDTHVVDQFERAYQSKNAKKMLFQLMVPTMDAGALEKRYQWLRGYGPHDLPGSVHPPILFQTSKGSFVPTQYSLMKSTRVSPGVWDNVVQEKGAYKDEDGRWSVTRERHIKVVKYGSKWYVGDYYLASNAEDYGFYVDDIADKMTKVQPH